MHNGRMIEELIATVEHAERQARTRELPLIVPPHEFNQYQAASPWICEWPRNQAVIGVA